MQHESLNYISMRQDKLVSVRLNEKTVATLEEYGKDHWGYSRSQLINMGANFIAYLIENRQFEKIRRFYPEFGDVVDEFTFKFHREHK